MKNKFLNVIIYILLLLIVGIFIYTYFHKTDSVVEISNIRINESSIELYIGDSIQLTTKIYPENATDKTVIWKSENTSVATVSSEGLVLGKNSGNTSVTMETPDGKFMSKCLVIVKKGKIVTPEPTPIPTPTPTPSIKNIDVEGVSINKKTLELFPGDTEKLVAEVTPSNATNKSITFSSSNPSIAYVDQSGNVTGIKNGLATITATSNNGKIITCQVTVNYVITSDSKLYSYKAVAGYDSKTLKYRILNIDNNDYVILWVKDAYMQMNSALAYSNGIGYLPAETILENEIKTYGYQNKGMIAINASFTWGSQGRIGNPMIISKGRIVIDVENTRYPASQMYGLFGLTKDYQLREYVFRSNDYDFNMKLRSEVLNDGIRNSFANTGDTSLDHGTDRVNRTQMCQIDKYNYIIFSGVGTVSECGRNVIKYMGCKLVFNLDGGGSRKLYYKTSSNNLIKRYGGDRKRPEMLYFVEQ